MAGPDLSPGYSSKVAPNYYANIFMHCEMENVSPEWKDADIVTKDLWKRRQQIAVITEAFHYWQLSARSSPALSSALCTKDLRLSYPRWNAVSDRIRAQHTWSLERAADPGKMMWTEKGRNCSSEFSSFQSCLTWKTGRHSGSFFFNYGCPTKFTNL